MYLNKLDYSLKIINVFYTLAGNQVNLHDKLNLDKGLSEVTLSLLACEKLKQRL